MVCCGILDIFVRPVDHPANELGRPRALFHNGERNQYFVRLFRNLLHFRRHRCNPVVAESKKGNSPAQSFARFDCDDTEQLSAVVHLITI